MSQRQSGGARGGGPVDCATNCAAELAAAEAAGEVTGNAEGRLARVLEWRNPGLFSTSPTQFDPSSLGTWSAPDANGEYTVTMATGTAAATPATGSSLIWPVPAANGAAITGSWLAGLLRVYATGWSGGSHPLLCWAVVMDDPDPTAAFGWGIGFDITPSARARPRGLATLTAGTWTAYAPSDASAIVGWMEGALHPDEVYAGTQVTGRLIGYKRTLAGGLSPNSAPAMLAASPPLEPGAFQDGTWVCVGLGAADTALPEGDYTIRAQALLADYDPTDAVGVGETP